MEKKRRIIGAEFHLPEGIIQHIQSFLTGKEAAQTTVLSKSWYAAWLTRPNLDFDYTDFERRYGTEDDAKRFSEFVENTFERYEKLNLKILSLRLWTRVNWQRYFRSLVSKWAVKALRMGATCLDFKIDNRYLPFYLPHEVLGSENLVRLSVSGYNINLGDVIRCSRLEYLTLDEVYVEGDKIRDIISSCPLIQNLTLRSVFREQNMGTVDSPFIKLKSLWLSGINVDALFFHDFSSKFPCLKDLSIDDCSGFKGIQISSPSLECISFTQCKMLRVRFDVPSVRRFTFSGTLLPSLSFITTSSHWESDISIRYSRLPMATWFLKLNKLLTKLSSSKVSLSLQICTRKRFQCSKDIEGLPKPEVENLMIVYPHTLYNPDIFDCLFRCCRPIYVTQHLSECVYSRERTSDFMEFVYKRVIQLVGMIGDCELSRVDVEFFDESVSAWRPRLVDAATSLGADEQGIRLHLIWGR